MPIDENIRKLIDNDANIDDIRNYAVKNGMTTLLDSAAQLALKGIISYDEVVRVGFTLG